MLSRPGVAIANVNKALLNLMLVLFCHRAHADPIQESSSACLPSTWGRGVLTMAV